MFGPEVSQAPMPLTSTISTVRLRNFFTPRKAARKPKMNRGPELPSMCAQLRCRNGAVTTPVRPVTSRVWMP